LALYVGKKVTSTRWRVKHKDGIRDWQQCKRLLQVRFGTKNESVMPKYSGLRFPADHFTKCTMQWILEPKQEWTHLIVHTLDIIPKNWYIELDVCRRIRDWEESTRNFKVRFSFENNNPLIDSILQVIKNNIFAS
jgi:hypothetical protein